MSLSNELADISELLRKLFTAKNQVLGNKETCCLLINRCLELEDLIRKLASSTSTPAAAAGGNVHATQLQQLQQLQQLRDILRSCLELVIKFTTKDWIRMVRDTAHAEAIDAEFKDLNERLSQCGGDLQKSLQHEYDHEQDYDHEHDH